jgi:hypothetical protein
LIQVIWRIRVVVLRHLKLTNSSLLFIKLRGLLYFLWHSRLPSESSYQVISIGSL